MGPVSSNRTEAEMTRRTLASVLFVAALAAGAPLDAVPVYVKVAPPAPRVEVKVVAPGPGYVWTGGYYRWKGGVYVWVPGAWLRPPRAGVVWVAGHWKSTPHGWVWIDGRWR
jgi:hypothetical protein